MVTKGLNKITQNETQDLQLVDNFCKSWVILAPPAGLEPATYGLTVRRSTD